MVAVPPGTPIPPGTPRIDQMFLVGIWFETLLYGINVVVFGATLVTLFRRMGQPATVFLICMSVLLFTMSTAYVGLSLDQLLDAFINGPEGHLNAILYFSNEPNPRAISKLVLYEVNVFSQNLILIWRMWVVYNQNWLMVILPVAIECMHLAGGFISIARGSHPGVPIFDPIIHKWSIVSWVMDLTVNICVTTLIVARILTVQRSLSSMTGRKSQYSSVVWTIVESGMLFTTATLITVSLYLSGNHAVVAAIDSTIQLASITPMLIIVRVGMGLSNNRSANASTYVGSNSKNMPSTASQDTIRFASRATRTKGSEMGTDQYNLQSFTEHEDDTKGRGGVWVGTHTTNDRT